MTCGVTGEMGMSDVETPVEICATILQQLGMNHEKLTFRFGGRDMRLKDVHGKVFKQGIS